MGYFYHINYIIISVKEKESKKKNKKKRRNERAREGEAKRKAKALGSSLIAHDTSVEVGYGLCLFIVNSK